MKFLKRKSKKTQKDTKGEKCLNCGKDLNPEDNFCPECGQINTTARISLKQYISDYLSGFFSFDNRFLKTVGPLIFKPGKVTKDFIDGKRIRYVNPFQLYLNITIIFFLVVGLFNLIDEFKISNLETQKQIEKNELKQAIDSVKVAIADSNEESNEEKNEIRVDFETDSILEIPEAKSKRGFLLKMNDFVLYDRDHEKMSITEALDSLGYKKNYWNTFAYSKAKNINRMTAEPDFLKNYLNNIYSKISIALFFLLPLFTIIVALLYLRTRYNYSEHLVFVFHTQTVFFIMLLFLIIFERIFDTSFGGFVFTLLFSFYLYKAMRNFYGQNRFVTFIKFFILNISYLILSLFGAIFISFIAFLF